MTLEKYKDRAVQHQETNKKIWHKNWGDMKAHLGREDRWQQEPEVEIVAVEEPRRVAIETEPSRGRGRFTSSPAIDAAAISALASSSVLGQDFASSSYAYLFRRVEVRFYFRAVGGGGRLNSAEICTGADPTEHVFYGLNQFYHGSKFLAGKAIFRAWTGPTEQGLNGFSSLLWNDNTQMSDI
jgi:hypothetical protein